MTRSVHQMALVDPEINQMITENIVKISAFLINIKQTDCSRSGAPEFLLIQFCSQYFVSCDHNLELIHICGDVYIFVILLCNTMTRFHRFLSWPYHTYVRGTFVSFYKGNNFKALFEERDTTFNFYVGQTDLNGKTGANHLWLFVLAFKGNDNSKSWETLALIYVAQQDYVIHSHLW